MWPYLEKLGFHLVGYGCTTCIGNSGPLNDETSKASTTTTSRSSRCSRATATSRADQPRREDELPRRRRWSSPTHWPARWTSTSSPSPGQGHRGQRRLPARPVAGAGRCRADDRREHHRRCSPATTPMSSPATSAGSRCPRQRATPSSGTPSPPTCASPRTSRACRWRPRRSRTSPARGCSPSSATRSPPTTSARPGRSRPTARRQVPRPARRRAQGLQPTASRRGNHEVMIRGTFANIRLKNLLLDGVEGGFTRNFLAGGAQTTISTRRRPARRPGSAGDPRGQGVRLRVLA